MGYKMDTKPVYPGDRITVQTFRGVKGNIVGRLPDGRTIVFDRDSPYLNMLGTGQSVECKVVRVAPRYVIVDPMRESEPLERTRRPVIEPEPREMEKPPETEKDGLLEDLRRLSEEGEWEKAVIAEALIHIIETLDASREPPTSSLTSPGEPPLDQSLDHELRRASDSFGLTQPEVRARKEPESKFLRYLDGLQEERVDDQEEKGDEAPVITLKTFGAVGDLPKDFRILTIGQTRYLKEHHLKGLDGCEGIEMFTVFFADASALERREYGKTFYVSMGTNPWNKVQRVTVGRAQVGKG